MLFFALMSSQPDTALPKGSENFWYYSSCCAVAGMETLGFYAASGLGGFLPVLVAAGTGGLGCLAYGSVAQQMTPIPELKPKAYRKAINGGILGAFVGGVVIIVSAYVTGK